MRQINNKDLTFVFVISLLRQKGESSGCRKMEMSVTKEVHSVNHDWMYIFYCVLRVSTLVKIHLQAIKDIKKVK